MRHILSLFLFCFILSARQAACIDTTIIGKFAPRFTLADVSGKKIALSDYQGMVIILHFWSTRCGHYKEEMPSLHNLFLENEKKGLIVLAVSKDDSETDVRSFIKKRLSHFPCFWTKTRGFPSTCIASATFQQAFSSTGTGSS